MNVANHAQDLYRQARNLKSPRDLEYEVLARLTGRLKAALAATGPASSAQRMTALHENRQFWTALAIDLAHPGNALPADLRARLFYLAEFTLQTTDRAVAGTADAEILAEINTIVMRGLRGEAAQ